MVTNDLDGKPFQLKFVRAAQMMLFSNITCDPPFGQSTVIPHDQTAANFCVFIESSISFPEQPWEAVLWHNGHDQKRWDELQLEEVTVEHEPLAVSSLLRPKVYRRYFHGSIPRSSHEGQSVQFTLKFRTASSHAWKWVNDQSTLRDGEIYFQADKLPERLQDCVGDFASSFTSKILRSEVPDTQLWSVTLPLAAAGSESVFSDETLGLPLDFTRWFALIRLWTPWLAPRHGKGTFDVKEDAVLCSFLRHDGLHLVLLALSGIEEVRTVFKQDGHGRIVVSSRNDGTEPGKARIVAAIGRTFETANAACMYTARKMVSGEEFLSEDLKAELRKPVDNDVQAQWMEEWYDGLTYCTWNGLGQDLTAQKIYNALDTLKTNNIKVTNLIIDDNWQSLDNAGESQFKRGWTDFDANKEGFPQGLKHAVTEIRDNNPSIQHVAVWHAMLGYWGGISPTGNIAQKYKTKEVQRQGVIPGTGLAMTVVDADDAQKLYNDFYQFLLQSGVDSVKTDAQFFLDLLDDASDRRRFIKAYQDAWTINSLRYFHTRAISCMSQIPQILFHSQLPTNKPRLMVRNSDDFFPEIPTSHPWHIFMNAFTSLFTSHLNILPDWDMFQTSHEYSSFHAAGRCVSGGPIYFTDEPGKHDINLINQMSAMTVQEKTVILRPSVIGKTIASGVYTSYEEERLLKVGTFHGNQSDGSGILGIFNVSPRPLSEMVMLHDFRGVEKGKEYVIRAHTTGEVSKPVKLDDILPLVSLEIQVKSWEILTAYPLQTFSSSLSAVPPGTTKVAVLGLLGKMTGAAAVTAVDLQEKGSGKVRILATVKAMGILGIYISDLGSRSIKDNFLGMILGQAIPISTVRKSDISENVLEIDIERAWKEMGLVSAWSNEVTLDLLMA